MGKQCSHCRSPHISDSESNSPNKLNNKSRREKGVNVQLQSSHQIWEAPTTGHITCQAVSPVVRGCRCNKIIYQSMADKASLYGEKVAKSGKIWAKYFQAQMKLQILTPLT